MKKILPILTLTTLAAAAFADAGVAAPAAPAAAGLVYNRVAVSYAISNGSNHDFGLEASTFIGSSNAILSASAGLTASGDDSVSIGYVFKNVYSGADVTVTAATNDTYGVLVRRALGEVLPGLEVALGYKSSTGSEKSDSVHYEVSYNINKLYSVAFYIEDYQGGTKASANSVAVRYNF